MKRSVRGPTVFAEFKHLAKPIVAGVLVLFAISALVDPSVPVFYLISSAIIGVLLVIEVKPPWLQRSPLGRWLRR